MFVTLVFGHLVFRLSILALCSAFGVYFCTILEPLAPLLGRFRPFWLHVGCLRGDPGGKASWRGSVRFGLPDNITKSSSVQLGLVSYNRPWGYGSVGVV